MKLVTQFENATLPLAEFHHAQHLEIALWYALHNPPEDALARMIAGLQRYLKANNIPAEKYSAAVTAAWMERIQQFLATADRAQSCEQLCRQLREEVAHLPVKLGAPESATIKDKP